MGGSMGMGKCYHKKKKKNLQTHEKIKILNFFKNLKKNSYINRSN